MRSWKRSNNYSAAFPAPPSLLVFLLLSVVAVRAFVPAASTSSSSAAAGSAPIASTMSSLAGMVADEKTRKGVQEYYGKVLSTSKDLKTNACTTGAGLPPYVKKIFPLLHDEVIAKYYGCGLCVPEQLEGCKVLDLGCGAGRDCYILSSLVGEHGQVVGVDMTPEQLEVANRHVAHHTANFGYSKPNVEFKMGYIEKLDELGLPDNHFDCIVSNCVINLSPDKDAVLREAYRVLKPGGELYFSDVYADRRMPQELVDDEVLFGECLSGALYWNDFIKLARKHGFKDPRLVEDSPITVGSAAIEEKVGHIRFYSATYRLFKIPELETDCEDYGEAIVYKGTVETCPKAFVLDGHHRFEVGKVEPVCRNTKLMLEQTRFKDHFEYLGSGKTHYGLYADCGKTIPFGQGSVADAFGKGSKGGSSGGGGGGGCC